MGSGETDSVHHAYLRVFEIAARLEPDHAKLLNWFHEDAIVELGNKTGKHLIDSGQGPMLEGFLMAILAGARGS
jgi:hypothetical protein